jgi:hypothetical protein
VGLTRSQHSYAGLRWRPSAVRKHKCRPQARLRDVGYLPGVVAFGYPGKRSLYCSAVPEIRPVRSLRGDGREELVALVDERVFPPDDVARRPPVFDVGVRLLGDEDAFVPSVARSVDAEFVSRSSENARLPVAPWTAIERSFL